MACALVVALFTWNVSLFHLPGKGFTYFIQIGSKVHDRLLPEVKAVNHIEMVDSEGYDSQWYAQIAVRPHLGDPALRKAVDSLPYRARRILFIWTAWLGGGGNPKRVLDAYSVQNVVCWYLLALLLLRWFPPISWGNTFRWSAVLFSFGLIFSVKSALPDGPSLLLIAIGMACIESGRLWAGAAIMGISGLGKDTSVLCGMALPPPSLRDRGTWMPWLARAVIVVAPLLVWIACLRLWLGHADDVGARNFARPLGGLADKLEDIVSTLGAAGSSDPWFTFYDILGVIGLAAQFFFFAGRIRWRDPWWRVGASYAVLMMFLGDAVWEHYPSAAVRVLLPMTLAFNVLVPRRGWWLLLLAVGNIGIIGSADLLKPPGRETFRVEGPSRLITNPVSDHAVEVIFGPRNWWTPEKSRWEYFRWSLGDCSLAIRNPQPFSILSDVRFSLRSVDARAALVSLNGTLVWQAILQPGEVRQAVIAGIVLPPGDTTLTFRSDRPGAYPGHEDKRRLTFSVRDLEIDLKEMY
jgi:hypothetical protein